MNTNSFARLTVDLTGILQGVGFRPTMARVMGKYGLTGWVRNQSGTVRLSVDGPTDSVNKLLLNIAEELPPKARLEGVRVISKTQIQKTEVAETFDILESLAGDAMRISIPADLAMCPDCKEEVFNKNSRYYSYPFTTCTNCGPRYTVVEAMPYDRAKTALKEFPLCEECLKEYKDPLNRRFHAESIACPECGPKLTYIDKDKDKEKEKEKTKKANTNKAIIKTREAIKEGKIVAVRGLGGFLLVADATNKEVLKKLRDRKHRPHKPFAVMAKNIATIKQQCFLSKEEETLMTSSQSPIVVLNTKDNSTLPLNLLSPNMNNLGVMLPTTPLHALLAEQLPGDPTKPFDFLLMTSGNRGGEPICITNEEALQRLDGLADCFLLHNREIYLRNDDSLAVVDNNETQIWRRARGYAPESIKFKKKFNKNILAMGAELKNTICLAFGNEAVLSPHIGNLETPEALDALELVTKNFPDYFKKQPELVAVDLHPDMHSRKLGQQIAKQANIPLVTIQHHYAHAMSVMAEHDLQESIALVFDGTGYGLDGTIWGAELLHVYPGGFKRLGTFKESQLLGGDQAIKKPSRQLLARFWESGLTVDDYWKKRLNINELEFNILRKQFDNKINSFPSHAAGRVFDAFSVGLGVSPGSITYEGQAAITLESKTKKIKENDINNKLPKLAFKTARQNGLFVVDLSQVFETLFYEKPNQKVATEWAIAFHNAIVDAALSMVDFAESKLPNLPVVLSGGVMMNRYVSNRLITELKQKKISVFKHNLVPPNDGGISLGQVYACL